MRLAIVPREADVMKRKQVAVRLRIWEARNPQRERCAEASSQRHNATRSGLGLGLTDHNFTFRDGAVMPLKLKARLP